MSDAETIRRRAAAAANNRRAAEASARAAASSAQAEAAKAAAQQSQTQLRIKELDAAAAKQKFDSQNSFAGRAWRATVDAGMPIAGIVAGYKFASGIEKRHIAAVGVRNRQLADVSKGISRTMAAKGRSVGRTAKLAAAVATADKLALAVSKGPKGVAFAGVLLAEGAMARFVVAPSLQSSNETAAELARGVGTASVFAASTMVAKRMIANATPKALPAAAHMAAVETARRMPGVAAAAAAQVPRPSILARVASVAGKVALPVAVAAAGYAAYQGYKRAGAAGAALGAADSLTFGIASPLARMAGYTPRSIASQRVAIAVQAARRVQTAVERHRIGGARLRSIAALPRSDGTTASYTRVQAGKTVRVSGYKTPRRR